MTQATFVERRSATWERLEALLRKTGSRGLRRLDAAEVAELGRLYRAVTSDLAYARGCEFEPGLLAYLNRLVARAHAYVYGSTTESGASRVARFFGQTFPQEVRRSFAFVAICTAITVACSVIAYAVIGSHPADAFALLDKDTVPAEIRKSLHDSNFGFDRHFAPAVSTAIIVNNIYVSVLAFSGCITLGALTIWVLVKNGLMLGGLAALFGAAGFGYDFWATIAPHGVIELTAIQIAGAASLLIVAAVLFPGRLRRRDAIALNARRAGTLILGVCAMLVVAGTIEGFISPQRWPPGTRIAIGALTAVALVAYLALGGRRREAI